jgi:hypothetical protein
VGISQQLPVFIFFMVPSLRTFLIFQARVNFYICVLAEAYRVIGEARHWVPGIRAIRHQLSIEIPVGTGSMAPGGMSLLM